jgi:hypothetical protein
MALGPSLGWAQTLQSFEELSLRVNLDDQLQVENQFGIKVTGRLTRLTRDELTIQTEAGEKRLARDTVRAVAVRTHPLRKGALIGAGVAAVLGAVATCSREGGGNCVVIGLFGAAPIGAGVGLAAGALTSQMTSVYRAPKDRASVPPLAAVINVQASLLEDLALRVNLDDQIQVEDQSGATTTGRLTRLRNDEITIGSGAGERHFTREAVRQVALRRQPLRMATLIGAGAGAAIGGVAACTGEDREECIDAPILAGAVGAGVGLAVGALIHKTAIVYPEPEKRTVVVPAVSRGAVGVYVNRRW